MARNEISITGAREHNLKNINVSIPRDSLVVLTGVSGSGKSSLAFDTIYAEGQRRYVESLSAYARQFLGLMEKPDVDYIDGLSPSISIDQKGVSRNPRSTVATVTEIYDYLRLLFARAGTPHCPNCDQKIERQSPQQIVDSILNEQIDTRAMILAPVVRHRRGEHAQIFEMIRKAGYIRVRVDGQILSIDDDITLSRQQHHNIEVIVDRIVIPRLDHENGDHERGRIADSVEQALQLGEGILFLTLLNNDGESAEEKTFSEHFACTKPECGGYSVGEIEPRNFSFNTPHGACPACTGLGYQMKVDETLVVPNKNLSVAQGGIVGLKGFTKAASWYRRRLQAVARSTGFELDTPLNELSDLQWSALMNGTGDTAIDELEFRSSSDATSVRKFRVRWEGVLNNLRRRHRETDSDWVRTEIEKYMARIQCDSCNGARLKPEILSVFIDKQSIVDVTELAVTDALNWIQTLQDEEQSPLGTREFAIGRQILKEIQGRLTFLRDVGLDYLSLNRSAATLSGGEGQRIRLATQIGSALMGVLYVCDEPSIGLHPVDNERLISTLTRLRDLGNTVLVVEHDEAMMLAADHLIDIGPGAGEHGGNIVATGTPNQVARNRKSITGAYLSGRKTIPVPKTRRSGNGKILSIVGAKENNLKNVTANIPLGTFVAVTGVSGSGKSSLINQILARQLAYELNGARSEKPGNHDELLGIENLDKVVVIDQSAIGRTPRSNPATYTQVFTLIRDLFAEMPEAKARGYKPGRFSFNVKGGRCESCRGDGYNLIEMQFLPDVTVPCEICHGARYNREALEILFRGKNIADVLGMTVTEAIDFFDAFPRPRRKLDTIRDVGLGYIRLGQPATTLSGGEAQRIKLATELSRRATGSTLYILDEPTTGLSFSDVDSLLQVLQRLVDTGNTVVVIEHHLDVIKNADWIIDLGPHGGERGGRILAEGTPEQIAKSKKSITGKYLRINPKNVPKKKPQR